MGFLSRDDLAILTIPGRDPRLVAIKERLAPRLIDMGRALVDELAVRTGEELHAHAAVHVRRKKKPPDETWVALGPTTRSYKKEPFFSIAVSRNAVHVRVTVTDDCPRKAEIGQVVVDRSEELARHAQQLGALRNFEVWDFEGLPEPAPAAEALFWSTLGNRVLAKKTSRLDIGVGWKGAEALRVGKSRLAEAVTRLMPFYHLMAFDRWRF